MFLSHKMNPSDQQSFEAATHASRLAMPQLTPGQRILRALELHELGLRLQQATAKAKKCHGALSVSEDSATYEAK